MTYKLDGAGSVAAMQRGSRLLVDVRHRCPTEWGRHRSRSAAVECGTDDDLARGRVQPFYGARSHNGAQVDTGAAAVREEDEVFTAHDCQTISGGSEISAWNRRRHVDARGIKGRWLSNIPVLHAVPVERQTVKHLRRALNGVGHELGIRSPARSKLEFRGIPLWLWRDALTFEARYRWRKFLSVSYGWHSDLAVAAISWGRIQRMLQDRR